MLSYYKRIGFSLLYQKRIQIFLFVSYNRAQAVSDSEWQHCLPSLSGRTNEMKYTYTIVAT